MAISRQALEEAAYASALMAGRRVHLERAVEEAEEIMATGNQRV